MGNYLLAICDIYFKNKICIKEIVYDFCQSKNLRAYLLYIYWTTKKSFDDKFSNIYNLLFILKNNNKLMLKLVVLQWRIFWEINWFYN